MASNENDDCFLAAEGGSEVSSEPSLSRIHHVFVCLGSFFYLLRLQWKKTENFDGFVP